MRRRGEIGSAETRRADGHLDSAVDFAIVLVMLLLDVFNPRPGRKVAFLHQRPRWPAVARSQTLFLRAHASLMEFAMADGVLDD